MPSDRASLASPDPDLDHRCANLYGDSYPGLIACKISGLSSLKGWKDSLRREDRHVESLVDVSEADYRSTERVEEAARDELLKLIEMYEAAVFNFLTVLLRDRSAAQDCTQDAFLRAYERLRRGQEVNAAWLYRVA